MFLLLMNFHEILTWKIWFWPIQKIFHEKMAHIHWISKEKKSKLSNFYDKFYDKT
jgi:hypothetical protein